MLRPPVSLARPAVVSGQSLPRVCRAQPQPSRLAKRRSLLRISQERTVSVQHAFVTSQGHARKRFRRALLTENLKLIEAASRELQHVGLDDALRVLVVSLSVATRAMSARRRGSPRG